MRRTSAFTLLESLVSLGMFLMVMALMASLMNAATIADRFLGAKDRIQEVAVSCLYRMAYEARSANKWLEPAAGSSPRLLIQTPDWLLESSEFPVSPSPFPSTWDPQDPAYQITVEYAINAGQLVRTLKAGAESWATPLLRDCQGLQVTRPDRNTASIALTILANGQSKKIWLTFWLPEEAWKAR
ncbi:type II secretion system protein [bacterium]|nr:type II secretion system protein [bacterium]